MLANDQYPISQRKPLLWMIGNSSIEGRMGC